jgi:hypothetical protein
MQIYKRINERLTPPYGVKFNVDISLDQPNRFLDHKIIAGKSIVLAYRANRVYLSSDNAENWKEYYRAELTIASGFIIDLDTILICFGNKNIGYSVQTLSISDGKLSDILSVNAAWHGVQGIGVAAGTIIFAEYLSNRKSDEQTFIYISRDNGFTWVKKAFQSPMDFRHVHACFPDLYIKGKWIISTGDNPQDCKWYESFDDGETWTNTKILLGEYSYISSNNTPALMRATSILIEEDFYYWVTDDLVGPDKHYYNKIDGRYASGSKLVRMNKSDYSIEVFCDIGYHARSLVNCGEFFGVITEAKVKGGSLDPQFHIVFKDDLKKSYHIGTFPNQGGSISGGSLSRASSCSFESTFFAFMDPKCSNEKRAIAKFSFELVGKDIRISTSEVVSEMKEYTYESCVLPYRLTLDRKGGAPTLIILHGHGNNHKATNFKRDGWNIIAPLDQYGEAGKGSWWLGENKEFFVRDALQSLIKSLKETQTIGDDIYFYGSSMGGYGAILHGILCGAKAVYANVPQIKLIGSSYHQEVQRSNFDAISNSSDFIENDLSNLLNRNSSPIPLFFICENRYSYFNYLKEQSNSFVNECIEKDINFHYEVLPKKGHDKNLGINQVVDLFEKYSFVDRSKEIS